MTEKAALRSLVGMHLTPDVFAVVMATGILSVAARDHFYSHIDGVFAALAATIFVLLCLAALLRFIATPAALIGKACDPDVALRLFTFVAACAILGTRFATHRRVTWALATTAALAWFILVPLVIGDIRSRSCADLRKHVHGAWMLSCVATAGLAITATDLAAGERWQGWVALSAALLALSLFCYGLIFGLIGWRVWTRPIVAEDVTPDSWILMGALAIAALAGARLSAALNVRAVSWWLVDAMHPVTFVLWIGSSLWLPVLLCAEVWRIQRKPGSVHVAGVWWSAVFPLGMYSSATQATASQVRLPVLTTISLVVFWIGLSLWVLVAAAFAHSTVRAVMGSPPRT